MKILVLGGMHGNEPLGIELVKLLQSRPLKSVDSVIANPRAVKQNTRFTKSDLNRSFGPNIADSYETRRAKLLQSKTRQYDLVLDFHNTQTSANDCCFVGLNCDERVYQALAKSGFDRYIEATYDCINKYCSNTVSIEISLESSLNSAQYWYEKIKLLQENQFSATPKLIAYKFFRRVTWDEAQHYHLEGWKPFEIISLQDCVALTLPSGNYVPIFIGSRYTEYFATLLLKIIPET